MIRDKQKWGELAELPGAKLPSLERIASLYTNVDISQLRDSLLLGSGCMQVRLYFSELPEPPEINYPAIHLTCPYCVYEKGNPGWHKLFLTGYASGKEPVAEELLWHENSLEHREGLLAKIRKMARQLAE